MENVAVMDLLSSVVDIETFMTPFFSIVFKDISIYFNGA